MDQAEKLRKMVKEQTAPRRVARVVTVTSGKGGVGKSNVSVNLALALSRLGNRVIILDADFGLANVEVMLGIRPRYNLADLMFHGKSLSDIITVGPENIGFISGGSGIQELTNLTRDQIVYLIQKLVELDEKADVIIVDTGAGISDAVLEFVASSSEVLLVATPEPTSITDAYALLKTLNRKTDIDLQNVVIKMIANRIDTYDDGKELYDKLSLVVNKFLSLKLEYLGAYRRILVCQNQL
jgi:flagellar biosynthesis protein FlhG